MIIYPLDKHNVWTGEALDVPATAKVTGPIDDPPPTLTGDQVAIRMGAQWIVLPEYPTPPAPGPRIPQTVTKRQAKQQLLLAGLLDSVKPAIDAIPDATERALVQIYWDDSQEFERQHPVLIELALGALGLTDEQLDQLFIAASQL